MKKIKFDNLQKNGFLRSILLLSIICFFFGGFELIPFENPKINKGIFTMGFFFQALFFSRFFWFKNYVQWNRKGASIRINSFWGKTINFANVKATELDGDLLRITRKDGKIFVFDLGEIVESDAHKLNELIVKNTIAEQVKS